MQWLKSPYPLLQNTRYKWLFALFSGVFVYLFLIVFEPFGAGQSINYKYVFLAGFGISVFLGVCVTYFVLPKLFLVFFRPEKWTIANEIILLSTCILIISTFNSFHYYYWRGDGAFYKTFFSFLKITTSIGIFPIVGLIFFTERTLSKQNLNKAQLLSTKLQRPVVEETVTVQIQEESVKATPIAMRLSQFVYAQSEGNYVTIFYLNDSTLSRKLIRLSLKQLEVQFKNHSQVKRCHRSYLINTEHIITIDGNARSLTIQLDKVPTSIPVSRSFSKADFY
ncbi:LytTR family transcriptional regulator DNA-binding domain-containing protein [Dokdonia genika]|uniref:LytTR family transcriptional regulator DNA-binding domain-containing protein n=1 Tax=Dokdonia genika TaxID=308113 RepID=A0ABV9L474_9FLAO